MNFLDDFFSWAKKFPPYFGALSIDLIIVATSVAFLWDPFQVFPLWVLTVSKIFFFIAIQWIWGPPAHPWGTPKEQSETFQKIACVEGLFCLLLILTHVWTLGAFFLQCGFTYGVLWGVRHLWKSLWKKKEHQMNSKMERTK